MRQHLPIQRDTGNKKPPLTARMSHSSTRANADPRTADLCTRRIYFVFNKIASWRFSGAQVALR
jgi:hypothetical protein